MGCVPTANKSRSLLSNNEREMWHLILNYSFDKRHFYFLKTFQDNYLENFGEFITETRLGKFVYELKKFLFLIGLQRRGKLEQDIELVPSPIVDRLWRTLLCNWEVYSQFCTRFLQGFYARDSYYFTKLGNYKKTIAYLTYYFGSVDQEVWPEYEAEISLERGHRGFLRIKLADFVEFHHHFNQVIKLDQVKTPQTILLTEQHALRRRYVIGELYNYLPPEKLSAKLNGSDNSLDQKVKDQGSRVNRSRSMQMGDDSGLFSALDRNASENSQINLSSLYAPINKLEQSKRMSKPAVNDDDSVMPEQESDDEIGSEKILVHYKRSPVKEPRHQADYSKKVKLKHYVSTYWEEKKHRINKPLLNYEIPDIVLQNFQNEICCSKHFTTLVFKEYKRFMLLTAIAKEDAHFYPSHYVRLAWEYHLVEAGNYQQFCQSIFNQVIMPLHFPREPTESQRIDYAATLMVYKKVFHGQATAPVWAPQHLQFKYDLFYDYKYFNVRAYMLNLINKIQKKDPPSQSELEQYNKALGDMETMTTPERGNFIKIYTRKQTSSLLET